MKTRSMASIGANNLLADSDVRLRRTISKTFIAISFATGLSTGAWGLAIMRWIEDPLPVEYRGAAAELLRKVRPKDAEQALGSVKAMLWQGRTRGDVHILMRVETGCWDHYCMTLVGHISNKVMHLDFVLEAGPAVHFTDVSHEFWGMKMDPPLVFETGNHAGLVAVLGPQGWVLTACANCTSSRAHRPPPESRSSESRPSPVPKFDTFEDFQRALKEKGFSR